MSKADLAIIVLALLGFALFLYGSNYFNSIIGWTGVYVCVGAILARAVLYLYESSRKKSIQKP